MVREKCEATEVKCGIGLSGNGIYYSILLLLSCERLNTHQEITRQRQSGNR